MSDGGGNMWLVGGAVAVIFAALSVGAVLVAWLLATFDQSRS